MTCQNAISKIFIDVYLQIECTPLVFDIKDRNVISICQRDILMFELDLFIQLRFK